MYVPLPKAAWRFKLILVGSLGKCSPDLNGNSTAYTMLPFSANQFEQIRSWIRLPWEFETVFSTASAQVVRMGNETGADGSQALCEHPHG